VSKKLFSLIVLAALVFTLLPATSLAAPPPQEEGTTYTVQKDDWLSKLADKEYGDLLAYPAIVYHNNLKAETDSTLASIENPDLIEVGWSIYLPSAAEAEAYLETAMEAAPTSATEGMEEIGGQINILGWEGYDDPDVFAPFYEATGVVPNSTYIGNNDEVISKYKAGGPGVYDIGNINSRYLDAMIKQGMLMPLDESRLPNMAELFPAWDEIQFGRGEDGELYAVPAYFGFSGLCWRADMVPEPDWDFWKQDEYKGKYAVTTNSLASMYMWGMLTGNGQDASKWTQEDLEEIKAYGLAQWQDAATTAASLGEQIDLLVRGDAVVTTDCFGYIANEAQKQGVDVGSVTPQEPAVKVWIDAYFILTGAQNIDAAYEWINYAISPEAQAQLAENLGTAVSNVRAYDLMDDELKAQLEFDTLNGSIRNAELNVLPDPDAEPPNVSLDDLYKAFDEIRATVQ
jgi:spermidine/putrescine transport system substrate-binding protein